MRLFFCGLLCSSALLMLCGCATFKGDSSLGQGPAPQTETKAAAPTPGTAGTQVSQPTSGTTGSVEVTPGTRAPGPAVEVPERSFDFGVMREDTDYSHAFVIRNVGTSELVIKKVQPG